MYHYISFWKRRKGGQIASSRVGSRRFGTITPNEMSLVREMKIFRAFPIASMRPPSVARRKRVKSVENEADQEQVIPRQFILTPLVTGHEHPSSQGYSHYQSISQWISVVLSWQQRREKENAKKDVRAYR